jgi:hypothetical protein
MVAPDSTELGTASGQLRVTDAKGPPAHHAASVNVTSFGVSIRVAHCPRLQSYEKICPLDHLFLAARAKDSRPPVVLESRQRAKLAVSFSALCRSLEVFGAGDTAANFAFS